MIYVLLGMAKSGTTLVSRTLHHSGISMISSEPTGSYDTGTYYERSAALDVNHELLRGSFVPPLRSLLPGVRARDRYVHSLALVRRRSLPRETPAAVAAQMRQMISGCAANNDDWGFKDPRTCMTYELWRQVLPEHRVIGVFRGFGQLLDRYNASGLYQLNLPRLYRVLRAWTLHNRGLLDALPKTPSILLRYETLMGEPEEFRRLEDFVGRRSPDERDPTKYRHRAGGSTLSLLARLLTPFLPESPSALLDRLEEARQTQAREWAEERQAP